MKLLIAITLVTLGFVWYLVHPVFGWFFSATGGAVLGAQLVDWIENRR